MAGINLFPYQLEAVHKMKNGCILCGGVGSGKSRTALAYYYEQNGGELNSEIYIPMGDPPQDLYIITTAHKRDTLEWEEEMCPFLLTTHREEGLYCHTVVVDSWNNIQKYKDIKDSFFIFDEQRVVGSGVWVKSFLHIAKNNHWILLSATPGDTWMDYIPVFIANGFYRNRTEFIQEHVVYNSYKKFRQVERYLGVHKLLRLRNTILVDMDFERPAETVHIPVFCEYDKTKYNDICKNRWNYQENRPIVNASEYCYQLRKLVNLDPSRGDQLLVLLVCHPRAIIFYNFDYELSYLKCLLQDMTVAEWNGHRHEAVPEGNSWAYLVQYTAGAEGWNCITTDTIIFFSQNYSYKTLHQSCGRIDRLNTPFKKLYYYHLQSTSGIDMAIRQTLAEKKQFNERKFVQ